MAKFYILSGDRYLLSNELVDALLSGRFPVNSANYKSFYLVFIRAVNKNSLDLVYDNLYYNPLFSELLMMHFLFRARYNSLQVNHFTVIYAT